MLNLTHHEGDANENHREISLHTCQNGQHQKDKKQEVLVRVWRKGDPDAQLVGM